MLISSYGAGLLVPAGHEYGPTQLFVDEVQDHLRVATRWLYAPHGWNMERFDWFEPQFGHQHSSVLLSPLQKVLITPFQ